MFFEKANDGKNRWWRWLVTIGGAFAAIIAGQIPLALFLAQQAAVPGLDAQDFWGAIPADIDSNLLLALFLFPFVLAFFVFWGLLRIVHGKALTSVMTGRPRFDWGRALAGFLIWFAILSVSIFAILPGESYVYQFDPAAFWPLLLIALLMFPIQTTLEEVFFRGYLMQGFSLVVRNRIVPLILVTGIFVFLHMENPEFSSGHGMVAVEYVMISLLLGVVAVLDDGLELPCGIHAANNLFLAVILSTRGGTLETNALFETDLQTLLQYATPLSLVPYLICFAVLMAIYRWRPGRLFDPIGRR